MSSAENAVALLQEGVDEIFQHSLISKADMAKMKAKLKAMDERYAYCQSVTKKRADLMHRNLDLVEGIVEISESLLCKVKTLPEGQRRIKLLSKLKRVQEKTESEFLQIECSDRKRLEG